MRLFLVNCVAADNLSQRFIYGIGRKQYQRIDVGVGHVYENEKGVGFYNRMNGLLSSMTLYKNAELQLIYALQELIWNVNM